MNKFIIAFIASTLLIGCSTAQLYQGTKQPPENIVIIEGSNVLASGGKSAKICALNHKELDSCESSIELLPGEHVLRIEVSSLGLTVHNKKYKYSFKAGERYHLGIAADRGGASSPALIYIGKYDKSTSKVIEDKKIIPLFKHAYM